MNAQSAHLNPDEQAIVDDEHPWPGLASFKERDADYFKGRDPDIDQLQTLVNRERLTVLFGVSGLGKSSLLQAGLFPRLHHDNLVPVYIRLDFTESAPNLREQVFTAIARQLQEKSVEAPVAQDNDTLWEYFHRKDAECWDDRNRIRIPLLCFDQFEEIFTLGREHLKQSSDLNRFIVELADLVEGRCPESVKNRLDAGPDESKNFNFSHHPYKLIFSFREDYLADLEGLRALMPSIIHNRVRLRHMNGEQAMAVADQTQGRLMEPKVAETIVRLVAGAACEDPRGLPELRIEPALLSLVCRELNERRIATQAGQIDAQSVASNREQILENFYERSLDRHPPALRRFVEDKLITVSGFRNSEAYDNALGIAGVTAAALDELVQCRVLRLEERDGIKRIELIHDVLCGVVRKSRDQRQLLEKQRQTEQERIEAEQREQAANTALYRSKRRALVFLILAGIALFSSVWGWWSWWDAKESRIKAQHALAMADFREAEQHYQNINIPYALAHLAHAVRSDPEWVSSRTLLVNLLQQRSWFQPAVTLKHQAGIQSAQLSPDGTQVVTSSADNTVRLWDAKTGKPLGEPMMQQDSVRSARFSPDGTRVVTISDDKTARLWDAKTSQPLGEPMTHQGSVQSPQFSPDGTRVVTISDDKTARLWDAKTGQPLGGPMTHLDSVSSAQFSPDGTRIITVSGGTTSLWDIRTGQPLGEPMIHQDSVLSAQFSPDGTRVVTASHDNTARLWDAKTGQSLGGPMTHLDSVSSAQFSPDGTRIVTVSKETARLWDVRTGKPLGNPMTQQGYVDSAQFSPDGTRVVTASDFTARLWNAMTGRALGEAMKHQSRVYSAQFSPDGSQVLTVSWDSAKLWNVKTSQTLAVVMAHQKPVWSAQFSPDGTRVITASLDKTARLWDALTGKALGEPMTHQDIVWSAQLSPDGTRVVTASDDNTARLWDAKTGQPLGEPMTHQNFVLSAQFSPDGARVVTASEDKTARLWNATTGKPLGEPMTHQNGVRSAQFSPDSTRVVTTSNDKAAHLWDARTGEPLGEPMTHQYEVNSARFSPDGMQVVTASTDRSARLWDAKTGKPLGIVMEPRFYVCSAQFSPDGTQVVTSSADNTVRLWDAKTGKPLGEPMMQQDSVRSARFSPDGTRVVTASGDKTARLWDSKTGKPLAEPMTHQNGVWSAQFSPDGTRVVTASNDKTARLWDVSPAVSGNFELLATLAEAVSGNHLSVLGAIEPVENQTERLNNLRRITANAPLGESTAESFIRWFLSDPWTRTVSPLSKLTVPDYIQQQIAAGRREQVEQEFPGHPLLRSEK